jgi:glycosyltransferase involved in cell wall biosynthesis
MKILILSQWCDPEPTFKGLQFARALSTRGHDVEVLTGFPNYPGGKLYPGYRMRPFLRETLDGVAILRVALYPSHDRSGFRRALNYISFGLSAAVAAFVVRKPDVVYVFHPPATTALAALTLRLARGVPFVYDVQDLGPETLVATGMVGSPLVLALLGAFLRFVYARAAAVVVLSDGFRVALMARGVPDRKIVVIPNWTIETPRPGDGDKGQDRVGQDGEFEVLYAGNLGKAQALETVLAAARILGERGSRARFVFLGSGVEMDSLRRESSALPNVTFRDRVEPSRVGTALARADALLVHLKDDPLFAITIPSKTQAYLRAGRPILMGVRGDAARMVEDAGAGLSFPPEDAQGLADQVIALMAMSPEARARMGAAGEAYYARHLSLDVGARRFIEVFERVCAPARRSSASVATDLDAEPRG